MSARKAIILILLAALPVGSIFAQSYVGTVFSPGRTGVTYSRTISDGIFIDVSANIDYGGCVLKQSRQPGALATFSYDFILKDWEHSFLYIGPGIALGYVRDKDRPYGLSCGITGTFGYEYRFSVPVSIGVSVMPLFGIHISNPGGGMLMELYRNGLNWSFGPQVSLRYDLDARSSKGADRIAAAGWPIDDAEHGSLEDDGDFAAVSAQEGSARRRRTWTLFTFGTEWGYSANFNHSYHYNYTSTNGRVDTRGNFMCLRNNGYITVHGGVNCGSHLNLSVYAGYEGIYKGQAIVPVTLRGTWLFGRNPLSQRWLAFLDGGWAVSPSQYDAGAIARAGAGYRIPLSRSVKLDLMLSYEYKYASIDIYDEGGAVVAADRVRRDDNYFSSINISLGITL
ncbi:MAG: hypothetical protein LUC24_00720 [Bacteroidales bacterium]|nr:hypothetical protein [Bacteroidales bacterium]